MDVSNKRPAQCLNCGDKLQGTYCALCGQRNGAARLNFRSLAASFIGHLIELDAPIFRTAGRLTVAPGAVCRDYIRGRRIRYTNPLKYAFLTTTLFVAVVLLFEIHVSDGLEALTGVKSGHRYRAIVESMINHIHLVGLPFTTLLVMALFHRSAYNFAEHLTFRLYTYGHVFVVYAIVAPFGSFSHPHVWLALHFFPVLYQAWAAVAFYGSSHVGAFLKMLAVGVCHFVVVGILGALAIAVSIFLT